MALVIAATGLTAGLLAGCGSGSSASTAAPAAAPTTATAASQPTASGSATDQASSATIHINSYKFQAPASVSAGSTVNVMNMDSEAHTVTADSGGAFDVKAPPGKTVSFTAPSKPGKYPFHCDYHSEMHGVLIVT